MTKEEIEEQTVELFRMGLRAKMEGIVGITKEEFEKKMREHIEEYHNEEIIKWQIEYQKMCMDATQRGFDEIRKEHDDKEVVEEKWVDTAFICGKCNCKIKRSDQDYAMKCFECDYVFSKGEVLET